MRRSVGVVLCLIALVTVAGCGGGGGHPGHSETIARSSFDGTWPFTVASGILRCTPGNDRPPLGDVVFKAGGANYGINPAATHDGFREPTPIRIKSRRSGSGYVVLGDVVYEGTTLCPKLGP